jgi:hypothetical protein
LISMWWYDGFSCNLYSINFILLLLIGSKQHRWNFFSSQFDGIISQVDGSFLILIWKFIRLSSMSATTMSHFIVYFPIWIPTSGTKRTFISEEFPIPFKTIAIIKVLISLVNFLILIIYHWNSVWPSGINTNSQILWCPPEIKCGASRFYR